jgi:hypothetical protein
MYLEKQIGKLRSKDDLREGVFVGRKGLRIN